MKLIIHEIVEKIIKRTEENLIRTLENNEDISEFIQNTKKVLDEVGADIVSDALETVDELIKSEKWRKRDWYVERKDDEKTLTTIFGDVRYTRTYYKNKITKEYKYLSDERLGIDVHDRMDTSLKSKLIENALDLSYKKSGEKVLEHVDLTAQTVMNSIRELDSVANSEVEIKEKKKVVPIIYIEADEDHVANQMGSCIEPKLIYVHEGRETISEGRRRLINVRYFTGVYKNSEELWLEVANYLEEAYDIDRCEKIYLSGDGARWIKEGLHWIKGSKYVLDKFHLAKYIKRSTAHMPHTTHVMWKYINAREKEFVRDLFDVIISETEDDIKKAVVKDGKRYVMNHWDGIINNYNDDYHGCSAEGHISHILSDRLSSRPLGWKETGADQMARLRVLRANGGKVYDLLLKKKRENKKEQRIEKISKRCIKNKIRKNVNEQLDNIEILNTGKRTGTYKTVLSLRGA